MVAPDTTSARSRRSTSSATAKTFGSCRLTRPSSGERGMRQGDSVRRRAAVVCALAASLLTLSAGPASALLPGSTGPCAEPDRARRGTIVRDALDAPGRDPMARTAGSTSRAASNEPVTVPVAFHVLALEQTAEGGWVSDEQLEEQIAVLSTSFSGATGGASSRFVFELSSVDRTLKERWFLLTSGTRSERRMKAALRDRKS